MLNSLIAFWRAHKCRARIVALLQPHVAQWRRDGGTDAELGTPAALGFLATLIAALAQREAGGIESDALGNLQAEVWQVLTGLPADDVGERIVALSVAGDAAFARGCRAALLFDAMRVRREERGPDGLGPTREADDLAASPSALAEDLELAAFWRGALAGESSDVLSGIS